MDLHLHGSSLILVGWVIRTRIRTGFADPDPEGQKCFSKIEKG
jgi:hypothetical protein